MKVILARAPLPVLLIIPLLLAHPAWGMDKFINDQDWQKQGYAEIKKGDVIQLPDGKSAQVADTLPDGDFRIDNGLIISPQGVIRDGVWAGEYVLVPGRPGGFSINSGIRLPDGGTSIVREALQDGNWRAQNGLVFSREGIILAGPDKGKMVAPLKKDHGHKATPADAPAVIVPGVTKAVPRPAVPMMPDEQPKEKQRAPLSVAQFLPLTPIHPKGEPSPKKASAPKKLEIPDKAKNASFLKGHTSCKTNLYNGHTGVPILDLAFDFDINGKGTSTTREAKDLCKGKARAQMRDGALHIQSGIMKCEKSKEPYNPMRITCVRKGRTTHCEGYNLPHGPAFSTTCMIIR